MGRVGIKERWSFGLLGVGGAWAIASGIAMGMRVLGVGQCPLHSSCRGQQQGLLPVPRCPNMVEGPERGSKMCYRDEMWLPW